jgi:vacuolar protein sorting-associated protein 29
MTEPANGDQVQGDVLVLYVYQLKKDANGVENVAVEKVSYRKGGTIQ